MFLLANGTTLFYSCFKVVLRLFRVDFRTTLFCIHFMVVLRLFRYQHRTTWFYKLFYGCSRVILAQSEELDRYRTTCPQNNVFGEVVPGLFHRYAQIAVWNNVVPNDILE